MRVRVSAERPCSWGRLDAEQLPDLCPELVAIRAGYDLRVDRQRCGRVAVAPNLDTLIELVRACGLDRPLELVSLDTGLDDRLAALQPLSAERRLERMLDRLPGAPADA